MGLPQAWTMCGLGAGRVESYDNLEDAAWKASGQICKRCLTACTRQIGEAKAPPIQ